MELSRRNVLVGAGAATIVAFDPLNRGWLSRASADTCSGAVSIPDLDGELVFDAASLEEGATDFGRIVSRQPLAVLRPASVEDIQRVICFANDNYVKVAMRGQAHSCFGQAQADCGIVIDSRTLNSIGSIDHTGVWADTGVKWSTLIQATLAEGLTPRVVTDYLELSVGGVLSVGGIGGASNRHGFVADNVEEIEVVTGEGRLRRIRRGPLFRSVLGGLGQFAIVVRAKISLDPAPAMARVYDLSYSSMSQFLADQRCVAEDERFDFLEGQLVPNDSGGFNFLIQAAQWFDPGSEPNDAGLTGDLSPDSSVITDFPYFVWLNRVAGAEAFYRSVGLWDTPKPWSDLFLSDRTIETYLTQALTVLTPADLGFGLALLYPIKRRNTRAPFVMTPRSRFVWAFDLLRFPVPDPAVIQALLDQNRTLFESARDAGGTRYPISALEFSEQDWRRHYGSRWRQFRARKRRYDPCNVLTPGQGIFG